MNKIKYEKPTPAVARHIRNELGISEEEYESMFEAIKRTEETQES